MERWDPNTGEECRGEVLSAECQVPSGKLAFRESAAERVGCAARGAAGF